MLYYDDFDYELSDVSVNLQAFDRVWHLGLSYIAKQILTPQLYKELFVGTYFLCNDRWI